MVWIKKNKEPFGALTILGSLDRFLITEMHQWGIPLLRTALGIVYLWFGVLKLIGQTPVTDLISQTYTFFPTQEFIMVLGVWEILIGAGLLCKKFLRITLGLLWLQMLGTFVSIVLSPSLFYNDSNILLLTMQGEFIIKNIVLTASGLVIGGYEIKSKKS